MLLKNVLLYNYEIHNTQSEFRLLLLLINTIGWYFQSSLAEGNCSIRLDDGYS